mmetsp:Transcript_62824/g.167798  ORF Transcript_62824/g.167798 Transcript_62824/m.167798 type:complete len:270 (+) Transcript_62824:65-874(+)
MAVAGGRASLGSAASLGGQSAALLLQLGHRRVGLRKGGVDADAVVEVLLRAARLHRHADALDDLASVGTQYVDPDNLLTLGHVDDDLHVTLVLGPLRIEVPLERDGCTVVDLHPLLAKLLLGILLTVAHRAKLDGREDRRCNIRVVHELGGAAEEPPHEVTASLDCHWCKLGLAVYDVADCIDVGHARLLVVAEQLAVALLDLQACSLAVQPAGAAGSAHGHEHRVIDTVLGILDKDTDLARLGLLKLGRDNTTDELGPMLLHVGPYHL